jgi:hypothetical protein
MPFESFEAKLQVTAQKDCDARWMKKNETTYYGYKNHVKTDVKPDGTKCR